MVILRDKIRFYEGRCSAIPGKLGSMHHGDSRRQTEPLQMSKVPPSPPALYADHDTIWSGMSLWPGQKLLDTLAETWDFFFSDVLPMLQAIFYPVQGKEPSVRQLALLHFRNIITLNIKLEDALSRSRARVPPSIIQMLLILQGVHESKGVSEDYLKLESLIQKVVSPYLGTYGLYSSDGPFMHSACILEKRFFRRSKSGDVLAKNPVVRSKSYNNPLLTPVAEYDTESIAANGTGIRRHSVSEMTSCLELQGYSNLTTVMDNGSKSSMTTMKSSLPGDQERPSTGSVQCSSKLSTAEQQTELFHAVGDPHRSFELDRDTSLLPVPSSSPENIVDQILESIDSDSEGIFIDFGRGCSNSSAYNVDVNRQSIV
ncbi:proline-rich protein 5 isoform X3 [Haemorhous mexicanus]|nr:proline-rich protein 5 isoform X3 [Haemorhous mexicanus]XP_059703948.1 proline-rich protein 5 isoform X3 [Haemorhous mexicanus]XP_059703949.1 proline-rich protein 5 isoform X3 [Haemorhous mexicanus]XP_059703950.1 proline-rich protein 5 isoform X3 [Haemorhous mexicanus]XP_059703951.1 proline-rich protein 5 isoform X3 [Haemorhous mexicanus]